MTAPAPWLTHFTVMAWFLWMSGEGPLLATTDGAFSLIYDRDGMCAYSIGDDERLTSLAVEDLRDRWTMVALRSSPATLSLWVGAGEVDVWPDAPHRPLSEFVVMKDAVGFAAHVASFGRVLPDERLAAYWEKGQRLV